MAFGRQGAMVLWLLAPLPARAQDGAEPIATTRHAVMVEGRRLAYTARAGRLPIRHNETGEVRGQMFFVAYALDQPAGSTPRPITFVWNGGPGSNAALTHLVGFGPRRIVPPRAGTPLRGTPGDGTPSGGRWTVEDNPGTWLGSTDLVFVDPIGTGYSRATRAEFAPDFYNDRGDAESVAEFIRVFRTRFDAFDAPLFLAGESYGVQRASRVARVLRARGIGVRGAILIGLAPPLGTLSAAQRTAYGLPSFTAAAHANGKLPAELQGDLGVALREAERWAEAVYAPALARRDSLGATEREAIVGGVARFTGIDPALVDRASLAVNRMQLGNYLLRREGRFVGQYDSRITGPLDTAQAIYDPTRDPSLADLTDPVAVVRYFRQALRFESDLQYQGPFGGGYPGATSFRGDWMSVKWVRPAAGSAAADSVPAMQAAMQEDPALRVLVGCGIYDLVCDYHGNDQLVRSLPRSLRDRVTVRRYPGGHAMYTDPAVHVTYARDVAQFIRQTLSAAQSGRETPSGTIEHTWTPLRDGAAQVWAIQVRTVVRGLPQESSTPFSLDVPITYAGVRGIADRVQGLQVRDAQGAVPFTTHDDAPHPGGFPHYRRFRAQRGVSWPVTVTYRSLAPRSLIGGPPFGLYSAHGGVSGAGSGFLVLPEGDLTVTTRVRWDLSAMSANSRAVTSWGEGDFTLSGSPAEVRQGWIMAGPVGRYPATGDGRGFSAYWLGTPAWDPVREMEWAARMYAWLGASYRYLQPLPDYRVFVRVGWNGGTALGNSFMGGASLRAPGAPPGGEAARTTYAHEMGHLFVGGIEAPLGVSSWFSEGLNVYYTRLLPMRGGFTSVEAYGREINRDFSSYWHNPARNLSADSIVRIGFNDGNVRHIPYTRGSLYFADLDARIRTHSGGRRTLDEVVLELFVRRKEGTPITHELWRVTVDREAGPGASADFDAIILRGEHLILPASDAFGPCFARRETAPGAASGTASGPGYEWVRVSGIPDDDCRSAR